MSDPAQAGADGHADRAADALARTSRSSSTIKRGLLAAVLGNPSTYPGLVVVYDVSQDCRQPVLQSTAPVARLGHESGFSRTARPSTPPAPRQTITAIDVTDPKRPHAIWQGNVTSHGMSLSDDGNRAYLADPDGELLDPRHQRDPGAQGRTRRRARSAA